ncbi:MAG: hypothetical protein HYU99_12060 [Deltaproteobacteria bacterium]|nr:hypothetical protein [Deltaproteobacteria bacterium]
MPGEFPQSYPIEESYEESFPGDLYLSEDYGVCEDEPAPSADETVADLSSADSFTLSGALTSFRKAAESYAERAHNRAVAVYQDAHSAYDYLRNRSWGEITADAAKAVAKAYPEETAAVARWAAEKLPIAVEKAAPIAKAIIPDSLEPQVEEVADSLANAAREYYVENWRETVHEIARKSPGLEAPLHSLEKYAGIKIEEPDELPAPALVEYQPDEEPEVSFFDEPSMAGFAAKDDAAFYEEEPFVYYYGNDDVVEAEAETGEVLTAAPADVAETENFLSETVSMPPAVVEQAEAAVASEKEPIAPEEAVEAESPEAVVVKANTKVVESDDRAGLTADETVVYSDVGSFPVDFARAPTQPAFAAGLKSGVEGEWQTIKGPENRRQTAPANRLPVEEAEGVETGLQEGDVDTRSVSIQGGKEGGAVAVLQAVSAEAGRVSKSAGSNVVRAPKPAGRSEADLQAEREISSGGSADVRAIPVPLAAQTASSRRDSSSGDTDFAAVVGSLDAPLNDVPGSGDKGFSDGRGKDPIENFYALADAGEAAPEDETFATDVDKSVLQLSDVVV